MNDVGQLSDIIFPVDDNPQCYPNLVHPQREYTLCVNLIRILILTPLFLESELDCNIHYLFQQILSWKPELTKFLSLNIKLDHNSTRIKPLK